MKAKHFGTCIHHMKTLPGCNRHRLEISIQAHHREIFNHLQEPFSQNLLLNVLSVIHVNSLHIAIKFRELSFAHESSEWSDLILWRWWLTHVFISGYAPLWFQQWGKEGKEKEEEERYVRRGMSAGVRKRWKKEIHRHGQTKPTPEWERQFPHNHLLLMCRNVRGRVINIVVTKAQHRVGAQRALFCGSHYQETWRRLESKAASVHCATKKMFPIWQHCLSLMSNKSRFCEFLHTAAIEIWI